LGSGSCIAPAPAPPSEVTAMLRKGLFTASNIMATIGAAIVLLMMLHIVVDITLRFFDVPLKATIEIVQAWYMVPVAFLPLAYVEKINGHISVELLSQHFGPRTQQILIACVSVLSAIYFGAFAWRTWLDALGKFEVREVALGDVAISVWPTRFLLPIGCGLITVFLLFKAVQLLRGDASLLEKDPDATPLD
jgi:TRAP-type C4-dicarboxylate transport system permease small subunit